MSKSSSTLVAALALSPDRAALARLACSIQELSLPTSEPLPQSSLLALASLPLQTSMFCRSIYRSVYLLRVLIL